MILTGNQIKKEVESNKISIVPFNENNLSTNSYDLTLGNHFIKYKEKTIDPKRENSYEALVVNDGKFLKLDAGDFYLASSREVVGSNYFVPLIHAKSGIARLGLFVHVTADLIDIGSRGNITFQLYATLPCKIYVGQKLHK